MKKHLAFAHLALLALLLGATFPLYAASSDNGKAVKKPAHFSSHGRVLMTKKAVRAALR